MGEVILDGPTNVKIFCIASEQTSKIFAIFEKLGFEKYFDKSKNLLHARTIQLPTSARKVGRNQNYLVILLSGRETLRL